jgi:Domain of unknown function (DUF4118)
MRTFERYRAAVVAAAAVVPLLACVLVVPFREHVANTNAALALVLLVVAAAATGIRAAGITAAVSAAVWYDFFLTRPYESFHISDRTDLETAALLVLVGVAVTEIALWGHRRQAEASRQEGYLNGVAGTAGMVAAGAPRPEPLIESVADELVEVLGIDDCRFDSGPVGDLPQLRRDGTVVHDGHTIDVDRRGLPTDTEIEVPVQHGGETLGHLLLVASTRVARPSVTQRRIAALLADQVGIALATRARRRDPA